MSQYLENRPVIIIETACAHDGNPEIARQLIQAAVHSGADYVQLQVFNSNWSISPRDPDQALSKQIMFQPDDWRSLISYAHSLDLRVCATVMERSSVDVCADAEVDRFKTHSSDLNNPYLLRYVAQVGKPVHLSVGGSTPDEIMSGINILEGAGCSEIVLMYGMQNFPTRTDQVNLRLMSNLGNLFGYPFGYQDHTNGDDLIGFVLPAVALALGAEYIEKHITYDRSKRGVDSEAALNPDEMVQFVRLVRETAKALGDGAFRWTEEAIRYRSYAKMKKVIVCRDVARGEMLDEQNTVVMRYRAGGLPASVYDDVVGRRAKRDLDAYHAVSWDDLE